LLQSVTVADRLIERFGLMEIYDEKYRVLARKQLARNVRISLGKKDGFITIEVDDHSPQRAADMANRFVDELRQLMAMLAITEAQQRRVFFERQLLQTRDKLVIAQKALQASGFNPGALKAEPKAAAETYARLRAEATSVEVRLQGLRSSLSESAPEVQQQLSVLAALRAQLSRVEQVTAATSDSSDYITRYRDFKYQETLLELFARQFELARVDESREGALIQVIDVALVPERKSAPRRSLMALGATLVSLILLAGGLLARQAWRRAGENPVSAAAMRRLRLALRPGR
jgi:capsule polysaccharide export protein KpsE/RkpR